MINEIGRTQYTDFDNSLKSHQAKTSSHQANPVQRDKVTLSPEGVRASLLNDMGLDPYIKEISISDIEKVFSKDLNFVEGFLNDILSGLNIDKETDFDVSVGVDGRITVNGDFPQKAILESRLNNNTELSNRFRRLSANGSLLQSFYESMEFQKQYTVDPQKAVDEFMYLLDDRRTINFSLAYSNGQFKPTYISGFSERARI